MISFMLLLAWRVYGVDGSSSFKFPENESNKAMELYIECWRADWDDFKKTETGWDYNDED